MSTPPVVFKLIDKEYLIIYDLRRFSHTPKESPERPREEAAVAISVVGPDAAPVVGAMTGAGVDCAIVGGGSPSGS